MVYIYISLVTIFKHFMIIMIDPEWGLGLDPFILCCSFYCYYGLFFLNNTDNGPYDF